MNIKHFAFIAVGIAGGWYAGKVYCTSGSAAGTAAAPKSGCAAIGLGGTAPSNPNGVIASTTSAQALLALVGAFLGWKYGK